MRIFTLFLTSALVAATPAPAQTTPSSESPDAPRTPLPYDRGYDKPSARTDAINASSRADVAAANDAANASSSASPTVTIAPEDQARYDADVASYQAALRANDRIAARDAAISARQERAYADAMWAWRRQVAACDRGNNRACRAPTPNPADFW